FVNIDSLPRVGIDVPVVGRKEIKRVWRIDVTEDMIECLPKAYDLGFVIAGSGPMDMCDCVDASPIEGEESFPGSLKESFLELSQRLGQRLVLNKLGSCIGHLIVG